MMEILLVFLAAAGVVLILWCLMGLLLLPVFGHNMLTLCFAKGEGIELENRVRAYGWLRDGKISGGRIVIVDCGLNANGLSRAQVLRERYVWVEYCPREALPDYMELMQDSI